VRDETRAVLRHRGAIDAVQLGRVRETHVRRSGRHRGWRACLGYARHDVGRVRARFLKIEKIVVPSVVLEDVLDERAATDGSVSVLAGGGIDDRLTG